jgi:regulator of replication initiation timing
MATKKAKDNGAEEVVEEVVEEEVQPASEKVSEGVSAAKDTINEAIKQVESLGKALGSALQDRANVVMVRVNNDSLRYLDMLVEADITRSRSESAAFLINEGIKANETLFNKIRDITDQIAALKAQLRETVEVEE